jgi:predicted AAA+ superfamily ATPase
MDYIPRAMKDKLAKVSGSFPVVLVTGPRQVGKTTLLQKESAPDRNYVSLDDPLLRELASTEPALFIQKYPPPVLIDEIQYAPQLLPYIKMRVDAKKESGQYWLTGSQMFSVMKGVSESLAGRVGILPLLGLSYDELTGNCLSVPFSPSTAYLEGKKKGSRPLPITALYERIFRGGMPYMSGESAERNTFFSSYIATYIQRDIRDLRQVADEMTFYSFLTSVASRTGQILNYADLSKDLGISAPTVKQWISILVSSGIIFLLEPFYSNIRKRLVKSPKIYFLDTGLCSYLTRWSDSQTLEAGNMNGAILETFVVSEIIKSYYNAGDSPRMSFFRDSNGREIDLLIQENNIWYPLEIKKSAHPDRNAVKAFAVLDELRVTRGEGGILCLCDDVIPIDAQDSYIPMSVI